MLRPFCTSGEFADLQRASILPGVYDLNRCNPEKIGVADRGFPGIEQDDQEQAPHRTRREGHLLTGRCC